MINRRKIISQILVAFGFLGIATAYFNSHYAVFFLSEDMRTFQNLFITKANAIETILISLFLILVAIYLKKHD